MSRTTAEATVREEVMPFDEADVGDGVTVDVVTVTPAQARSWLDRMSENRTLRVARTARYARDMENGEWRLTGEPIKFDTDGNLRDGQHRLRACIESDTPFTTMVVRGIPEEAFDMMDAGASRSAADVLGIRGETNTQAMESIARDIWLWQNNNLWRRTSERMPTRREILDTVSSYHELVSRWAGTHHTFADLTRPTKLSGDCAIFELAGFDTETVTEFAEKLAVGYGLDKDNPILHLRTRLIRDKANTKERMTLKHRRALVFKAFNAYVTDTPVSLLKWDEREDYPQVVDPASAVAA